MSERTRNPLQRAQLIAQAVEVVCPMCGAAQPNPKDGSEQWLRSNFVGIQSARACVSCDAMLSIAYDPKVQFATNQGAKS